MSGYHKACKYTSAAQLKYIEEIDILVIMDAVKV